MIKMTNYAGYTIKELCTWDTFKTIEASVRKGFIQHLACEFHANTSNIADMFNVERSVVDTYFKKHDIYPFKGKSIDETKLKKWKEFLNELKNERKKNKFEIISEQLIHGELTLEGLTSDVLSTINSLCKNKKITITVKW